MCDCARVSLQSPSLCTWQQYSGPEPETFGFVFGFSFVFVFVLGFAFVFGFVFGFAYGINVLVLARHPDFGDRVRGVVEGIEILVVGLNTSYIV